MRIFLAATFVFVFLTVFCQAQTSSSANPKKPISIPPTATVKASPAYAEVLLRKTERQAALEEFLLDYTEEFPKVKEIRYELSLIEKEFKKILVVPAAEAGKLSLALGKLMVRKIEIETDLWNLRQQYNDDHPEVKRARRKTEVFDKAIKEIIP